MQPRVSSAAGPAPATGTAQAGAADSTLMPRKDWHLFCALNQRDNPTPLSILTSGNKSSFMDGPPLPPFPLDLPCLCLRCLN